MSLKLLPTGNRTKKHEEIYQVADDWGMDALIFGKAVNTYSTSRPEEIPFLEDIR